MNKFVQPISLAFVILSFFVIRLMILPGVSFNQNVWDDEVDWISDAKNKSLLDYMVYRDAPGYFVFVPRIIIMLGDYIPSIDSISPLRILVFSIHIVCFASAVACIPNFKSNWKFSVLLYFALLITYIEDLNYVHNVGYIFIFPIFFLVFQKILSGETVPLWRIALAALLISKPFTAVLIVALVCLFVLHRTDQI